MTGPSLAGGSYLSKSQGRPVMKATTESADLLCHAMPRCAMLCVSTARQRSPSNDRHPVCTVRADEPFWHPCHSLPLPSLFSASSLPFLFLPPCGWMLSSARKLRRPYVIGPAVTECLEPLAVHYWRLRDERATNTTQDAVDE